MTATKKIVIIATLISAFAAIALLAGTTGVLATNMPNTDTAAPVEAETPIESEPITVITSAEPSDISAEPNPDTSDVPAEPVSDAFGAEEPAAPANEPDAVPTTDSVTENVTISDPTVCSHCGSSDHSTTYCAKKAVEERGAYGRWRIPSVGLDVAVFYVDSLAPLSTKRAITDAADSATYYYMGNTLVVGDHNNQGFNAIKSCEVGTTAYLDTGDTIQKFVCTEIGVGSNRVEPMDTPKGYGRTLRYSDGEYVELAFRGGLICYTCNENADNVTIVSFAPAY